MVIVGTHLDLLWFALGIRSAHSDAAADENAMSLLLVLAINGVASRKYQTMQ
jgi:hypothetical protein